MSPTTLPVVDPRVMFLPTQDAYLGYRSIINLIIIGVVRYLPDSF